MASYEEINQMLAEIGPEMEVVEISAFEESQSWLIALDEDTEDALALHCVEPMGKLVFAVDLGAPPEGKEAKTHEYLLAYNSAWADTDGVRMALDMDSGGIVQLYDLPLHALTADLLGSVIGNFLQLMVTMRAIVIEGIGDPQPPGGGHTTAHGPAPLGELRV